LGKDIVNIEDITFNTARDGPAYSRIKVLQYTTMFKMYSEIMQDYNENLLHYQDKCSSLLHQQRRLCKKAIFPIDTNYLITNINFIFNFIFIFSKETNYK
jgi:hypothetical protein